MSTSPEPDGGPVPHADDPLVAELLARCTFPQAPPAPPDTGPPVPCAVSGGPDSVALLALAVATGLRVTAVHVDHGHRADSHRDAEFVRSLATRWGAEFRAERVEVPDGSDLEARWRAARRDVLTPGTLLGHTSDDQAETLLVRLLRGTGPSGLASMDACTHPLLALRRSDTEALCAHLGIQPLRDPANADPRFVRNRIRHEILPLLDDVAGRDVVPLLSRLGSQAAAQRSFVEASAADLDPTDARALRSAPRLLVAEALRRWWRECTGLAHPPDEAATERMLDVACGGAVACDVVAGWRLERSGGRLMLRHAGSRSGGSRHDQPRSGWTRRTDE